MTNEHLKSLEIYKRVFEDSPDALLLIDTKGKILRVNKRVTDWLGYKTEEVEGKSMVNIPFLTTGSKAKVFKQFAKRMLGKEVAPYELTFLNKKGREIIGLIRAVPIRDDKGKIILDFALITNIYKERSLLQKYKAIVDLSPDGIVTTDIKGFITSVNPASSNMLGYKEEEMIGRHFTKLGVFKIKEVPKYLKVFKEIISGEDKGIIESIYYRKDGGKFYGATKVVLLKDNNKITGIQAITRDVTDQKHAEEIFKTLFYSSKDAIMTLTAEDGFLSGNPATIKMFECKNEEQFKDLSPSQLSPELQPNGKSSSTEAKKNMEIAMQRGSNYFEWVHKKLDGKEFTATVLLAKVEVNGKNVLQATVRDITKQKELEVQNKKHLGQVERMNKLMVGRELKMIELKKEIDKLKNKYIV